MKELAHSSPRRGSFRVFIVGGGTAVLLGWRDSTVDADLHADRDEIFRDIQEIKERLGLNVEFARPEHFVPPLAGSDRRHIFIESERNVSFYHYDPYAQVLSKVVRGFARDIEDARQFIVAGLVDPERLRSLVRGIPSKAYAKYPALSPEAVRQTVETFLDAGGRSG